MRERPTVIALHGGPGADHTLFKPAFAGVAEFTQVVYLDQRGSGRSDRRGPRQWTWERWADDVVDLCDALDIADPVLVGTSSGGWVALTAAIRLPDRLAGLVLDGVMPGGTEERLDIFERLDRVGCPTLVLAGEYDPVATVAAALPEASLHVLPDAGHGAFREAPEDSIALLREFVKRFSA